MGYILPVQFHQYEDYQKRISNNTRDKYHIEKPFKTILETQYEEVKDTAPDKRKNQKRIRQTAQKFAQFTGKGRNFNGMI